MAPEPGAKRKRGRPSNASIMADASRMTANPADDEDYGADRPKKRGRPRKSEGSRPRPSTAAAARRTSGEPKRRGRPPGSKNKAKIGKKGIPQALSGPKSSRPRESLASTPGTMNRRRESLSDNELEEAAELEDIPPSPEKPYAHVAPYVRRVRQATIQSKWEPLAPSSVKSLTSILQLAHRPILQRLSDTQNRQTQTSLALRAITHNIIKKINGGLPFPPSSMVPPRGKGSGTRGRPRNLPDAGREAEVDFESVLDAKQALERQLDPAMHAVDLLTTELDRMQKELEMDYEALRNLQEGARVQAREHRQQLNKTHVLAPEARGSSKKRIPQESDLVFKQDGQLTDNPFQGVKGELKPIVSQLDNHVSNLRSHIDETGGDIVPQLELSKAALQDLLSRSLDAEVYEQVVLGNTPMI